MSKSNSKSFSWAKRWSWKSFQSFSWQGLTTGFSKCKMKTQLLSRFLTQLSCQSTATATARSGMLQLQNLQGWCSLGPCSTAALLSCWTSVLLTTKVSSHKVCAGHSSCCVTEQFGSVIPVTPSGASVVCWLITLKPPLHQTSSARRSQPLLKACDHLGSSALEPLQFIQIPLQLGSPQLHSSTLSSAKQMGI